MEPTYLPVARSPSLVAQHPAWAVGRGRDATPTPAEHRRHRRAHPLWREGDVTATKTPTDIRNIPQALTIVSGSRSRTSRSAQSASCCCSSRRVLQFGRGQSRHDRTARQFEHRRLLRRRRARRRPVFPRFLQRRPRRGAERPERDDLRPRRRRRSCQPRPQAADVQRRRERAGVGRQLGRACASAATSTSRCPTRSASV